MSKLSRTLRYYLLTLRDLLVSVGPIAILPVLLLGLAYWWLNPNPPREVTLATGPAQSAYERFGKAYAEALAAKASPCTCCRRKAPPPTCSCWPTAAPTWALCKGARPRPRAPTMTRPWCRWAACLSSRSGCFTGPTQRPQSLRAPDSPSTAWSSCGGCASTWAPQARACRP